MSKKIIGRDTITIEEAFNDFTPEQNKRVEEELEYLYTLHALRKLRKTLKLTQSELAEKADLPRTTITKIESGSYNPTIQTLMRISSAMDKKLKITFE